MSDYDPDELRRCLEGIARQMELMYSHQDVRAENLLAALEQVRRAEQRTSIELANASNMIEVHSGGMGNLLNMINYLSQRVWQTQRSLGLPMGELIENYSFIDLVNVLLLNQRAAMARRAGPARQPGKRPMRREVGDLAQQQEELRRRAPSNWEVYQKAFEVGRESYRDLPPGSCSTEHHEEARLFRKFLSPYLTGYVLDIGCGPQSIPAYLMDYDYTLIHGVDPLPPQEPHPFEFVQAYGEFLPWADESFDAVISGTTLDHYFLLDVGIDEAVRVLRPGGVFIAWITLFEGAPAYDPYGEPVTPYDSEHLYHIDRAWFDALMLERGFTVAEIMTFERPHHFGFMVYEKGPAAKHLPASTVDSSRSLSPAVETDREVSANSEVTLKTAATFGLETADPAEPAGTPEKDLEPSAAGAMAATAQKPEVVQGSQVAQQRPIRRRSKARRPSSSSATADVGQGADKAISDSQP